MKRIDLIAWARPNFMRIAPIIGAVHTAETGGSSFQFRLIHTGQHYDRALSGSFFEELGIWIRESIWKLARASRLNRPPPS